MRADLWTHVRRWRWAVHALALALYTLMAVVAMWALVANLGTAAPAGRETDYPLFHWNFWWMQFALRNGLDLLHTNWILFPLEHNLSMHTLTLSFLPAYLVLEPLVGRVAAFNLMTLACPVLTAYTMFLFLRRYLCNISILSPDRPVGAQIVSFDAALQQANLTPGRAWANDALALIGGFAFGFLPYEITHLAWAQLSYTALWWFPVTLLLWDKVVEANDRRRRAAWAAALGAAVWDAWLTDTQVLLWLAPVVIPYGLYALWRAEPRRRRPLIGGVALALAAMLALGWIVPLRAMLEVNQSLFPRADLYSARYLSMPVGSLLLMPGPDDRGFGRLLVLLAASGAILSLVRRPAIGPSPPNDLRSPPSPTAGGGHGRSISHDGRWLWLAIAGVSMLLALGPDVEIGGQVIPLPYRVLHELLQGQYRAPVRLSVPGLFALIVFCVLTWRPVVVRLRRLALLTATAGMIAAFALDFGVLAPFPVDSPRDYAIYHEIGRESGDWVIFEIPTGVHSGYTGLGTGKTLMYYAPVHQKRLVNGMISRIPWTSHVFYEQSALLTGFAGNELDTQAVPRELAQAVDEWPAGYVIVHPDLLPSERLWEYVGLLNTQDAICFYKAEEGLLIYRAHWHPGGCPPRTPPPDASGAYVLDFGEPGDAAFVGEYWYRAEDVGGVQARWAGSNDASRVRVELPVGGYMVTLVGTGYGAGQAVEVRANGVVLGECELGEGWRECEVRLPAAVVGEGEVLLVLSHRAPETAPDGRTLTAAYDRIIFAPSEEPNAR